MTATLPEPVPLPESETATARTRAAAVYDSVRLLRNLGAFSEESSGSGGTAAAPGEEGPPEGDEN